MYLAFLVLLLAVALHGTLMPQLAPLWGTRSLAVLLGLLTLLALGVVEPTVRALVLQAEGQQQKDFQAQRLAQAAEHTAALVLITDADDRIEWANAAFTQATGWRLAEVKGLLPDELLHNPAADPQPGAQRRSAVQRGAG